MVALGLAMIAGLFALICLGCVGLSMKLATEVWKVRELTKGGLMSAKAPGIAPGDPETKETGVYRGRRSQDRP